MPGRGALLKCLFALAVWLAAGPPARAETEPSPDRYQLVRDCRDEWLVYSQEYRNYVPYTRALHESATSVSILLNLVRNRHFLLFLKADREAFVFIDGALERVLTPGVWNPVSCDSLYRAYDKPEVMLTVFGLRGTDGLSALMVSPRPEIAGDSTSVLTPSLISLKPKSANVFRDFSVVAWLLILLVTAVVFISVPSIAYKITSPLVFFSRDFRSELYNHHRAYSPVIVVMAAVLALICAFLLIAVERNVTSVLPAVLAVSDSDSIWGLTGDFLKIGLICFLLFYLKYFIISVTLGILNMSDIASIHFIKSVQASLLFYGALSAGLLLVILEAPDLLPGLNEALLGLVTAYYGIRFFMLYILLNQSSRIINLYLISYLCVVELIPLIIGIKFIM